MRRSSPSRVPAFTLIELLVVISIIGLLASLVSVSVAGAEQKARDSRRLSDLQTMSIALDELKSDTGGVPIDVDTSGWFSVWDYNYQNAPYHQAHPGANFWSGECLPDGYACSPFTTVGLWLPGLYTALVTDGQYLANLPVDPINKESLPANALGDGAPADLGYTYTSADGLTYTLGTNLETSAVPLLPINDTGDYQITH